MKVKEEPQQQVKQELAMPSVVVKAEPPDDAKAVFVVDFPTMQCTMHRGGEHLTAPLEKGPMQLLVAKFGDIVHTTELCNLMLFAAPAPKTQKKPAAADVSKKPAAAVEMGEADAAEPADAPEDAVEPGRDVSHYLIMWYKNNKTIGIRAKWGAKPQVLSFGGSKCKRTEALMREHAKVIIQDLASGISVASCKQKGRDFAFEEP